MLANKSLKEFLEETASNKPVPGGGSIAAMCGATAAALTGMVANLTIGKKKYAEVEELMKEIEEKTSDLRNKFIDDIDRDADSFNEVMDAFKLPKETDEEIVSRKKAIQEATKKAALVPLEVAEEALKIMSIIETVVESGNQNAVTDGAVAAMMARTAVLSALYNVKINVLSIKDEVFVMDVNQKVNELEKKAVELEKQILDKVVL
ncbi:cyclodeaminase/cyclohydrolase family protein [Alkaliphilus peptidifermentans]|uniref:Formiminotetrahydrofolate cyclodeaminase n=1 Tax=Alkaliphilus peptidifermentans DSM 18978 TaxID=1120976 RepID=A0A1G5KZ09_9FIRM|nr:cyclodeaminase/cyclohydrolase family protein [Alkaliphilus peptidifermentans]SCZ05310.1 formiminotetrahydrofolate cyclodeaminase [Alkaliphilus peptidifermentans DSM 18978]